MAKQIAAPIASVQRRTFVAAVNAASRPVVAKSAVAQQQTRGFKTVDFAGTSEVVYGMLSCLFIFD